MEIHPRKGVLKKKFPNTRKQSLRWACGEPGISEGKITGRKNK